MTDHELLELIVEKVSGVDQKVDGIDRRLTGVEQKVSNIDQRLTGVEQKVSNIDQDLKLIKTQQSEHGQMLQSLMHASQSQKAHFDSLQLEMAKLSGAVRQGFEAQAEAIRALTDMYGQHELELAKLKRKSG